MFGINHFAMATSKEKTILISDPEKISQLGAIFDMLKSLAPFFNIQLRMI